MILNTFTRIVMLCLILIGCACSSVGFKTPLQQTEAGCVSVSAAVKVLTVANNAGKLSKEQQSQVTAAIARTDHYCRPVNPPAEGVEQLAFDQAIALLEAYVAKVKP